MATGQQETPNIDETLNKTDFGQVINENKKPIMIGFVLILVGIVAYSVFSHFQAKQHTVKLNKAFDIQATVFTPYLEGKTKTADFIKSLKEVNQSFVGEVTLVPAFLEALNKLNKEDKAALIAELALVEAWYKNLKTGTELQMLFGLSLVSLYEDNKKYDEAIKVLEVLIASKNDVLKSKLYLDLGRIYLSKNDKTNAASNFQFIVDKYADSDEAPMAKLYLSELK